ncbi:ROK family transcriptional regulator [Nonomuraea sp. NPDC050783]|uniref:ROK family transcriptional regulator n=1 Tax=Nonomuraea sp. NPDC050783 TaxID=3154634 RepID=UPI0034650C90
MTSEIRVLDTLLRDRAVTRPQIAATTQLSKPAVSEAIRRLEQMRIVRAIGTRRGDRGRSAVAYELSSDIGAVVGMDLGGMNIRVRIANPHGDPLAEATEATRRLGAPEVAEQAIALMFRTLADHALEGLPLLALGISTPGVVDPVTHRVTLGYNIDANGTFDLLPLIADRFPGMAAVDNNVNCAARAEQRRGHARDVPTFAFVSVGAGIGMGVVYEGTLLRGRRGAAGEIAYMPLAVDPFSPEHRRRGALEDDASAAGMLDAAARRIGWPSGPPQTVEQLFALAASGVLAAQEVIDREAKLLAMAISGVCTVIDPDLVVLGGGIGANPHLLPAVTKGVDLLLPVPPRIMTTALGAQASVVGATELALDLAHDELRRRASPS